MSFQEKRNILEIGGGYILELAEFELKKILKNIADPSTELDKPRTLTIQMKFTPNEDRSQIAVESATKISLAPYKPKKTVLFNSQFRDPVSGEIKTKLQEISAVPAGQISIDGTINEPEVYLIGQD